MIKWIKSLIEKIFGKFCQCKDEHIAMYEDVLVCVEPGYAGFANANNTNKTISMPVK